MRDGMNFNRFKWLDVKGGFLDGVHIGFAPGLNCIIGARGSGKTTVLELIRFVLNQMPEEPAARKRLQALVESNLDFGRVELCVETKDGLNYVIARSANEDPVVLTEDRQPAEIAFRSGGPFSADLFSQDEVENIADQAAAQLELLENLAAEQISRIDLEQRRVQADLTANANTIQPLEARAAELQEELTVLPGVETRLANLVKSSGPDLRPIAAAQDQRVLRERQKRATEAIDHFLNEYRTSVTQQIGTLKREVVTRFPQELFKGSQKALWADYLQLLQDCATEVDRELNQVVAVIANSQERLAVMKKQLANDSAKQEAEYQALLQNHQSAQNTAQERWGLERSRNDLVAKGVALEQIHHQLNDLQKQRTELLQRLAECRDERFRIHAEVVDRLNRALHPAIRVSVKQGAIREGYAELLESRLKDARLKQKIAAQKITGVMWPVDLADVIRKKDTAYLATVADLSPDQAARVIAALSSDEVLFKLEQLDLIDQPKIELKVGESYRASDCLSIGQKCTTVLPILLLESEKPLLIDQPEDNLDNAFISQTVVTSLRRIKGKRQVILVTHNPNIPVLGDAAKVLVLEADGETAHLAREGTVDECKEEIVSLLEGGESAFKQRQKRYAY